MVHVVSENEDVAAEFDPSRLLDGVVLRGRTGSTGRFSCIEVHKTHQDDSDVRVTSADLLDGNRHDLAVLLTVLAQSRDGLDPHRRRRMRPSAVPDSTKLAVTSSEKVDRLAAVVEVGSIDDKVGEVPAGSDASAFDACSLRVASGERNLGGDGDGGEGKGAAETCRDERESADGRVERAQEAKRTGKRRTKLTIAVRSPSEHLSILQPRQAVLLARHQLGDPHSPQRRNLMQRRREPDILLQRALYLVVIVDTNEVVNGNDGGRDRCSRHA
jgi:hypothetical protein